MIKLYNSLIKDSNSFVDNITYKELREISSKYYDLQTRCGICDNGVIRNESGEIIEDCRICKGTGLLNFNK